MKYFILLIPFLLTSCPDEKNPCFKDGETKMLVDEQGIRYSVTHVDHDAYRVIPLDKPIAPPQSPSTASQAQQGVEAVKTATTPQIDSKWK